MIELPLGEGVQELADAGILTVESIRDQRGMRHIRQLRIYFKNGLVLSVAWGTFSYSDNYVTSLHDQPLIETPTKVEIAVLAPGDEGDGDFVELPNGGNVMGYVPVSVLPQVVEQLAAMTPGDLTIQGGILGDLSGSLQEYDEEFWQDTMLRAARIGSIEVMSLPRPDDDDWWEGTDDD